MTFVPIETNRLILRQWRESDVEPFGAINADPEVMRHHPATLSRTETAEMIGRIRTHWYERGFGPFVVETKQDEQFVGYVGLSIPRHAYAFQPCIEVGWRLARRFWGFGYATEAAHEALRWGFADLGIEEILAITTPDNVRSRAVMDKIGMVYAAGEEFDHPSLPPDSPLLRHVLYRASRKTWLSAHAPV